ncbi:hypothetical protein BC831DRAFT_449432 [Entophlyctis helioformis]|nr:hypothetical protein BC831DRAFT_449432 [Entophlyctis helioformis]
MPRTLPTLAFFGDSEPTHPPVTLSSQPAATAFERRWARTLHALKARPPPRTFLVLQVFRRQDLALSYQAAHPSLPLRLFSFEDDAAAPGRRKFLVTTIEDFWHRYRDMAPARRHYYEMLLEGCPAHLYFDIEYETARNPCTDGNTLIKAFTQFVCVRYAKVCGCDAREIRVVDLESTTAAKFSRHLIVKSPCAAFRDTSHVGRFVAGLVLELEQARRSIHEQSMSGERAGVGSQDEANVRMLAMHAFVVSDDGIPKLFIDTSVYSRNRNFRLWLSCKIGKSAVLEAAADGPAIPFTESGFRTTLASDVEPGVRILDFGSDGSASLRSSASTHAHNTTSRNTSQCIPGSLFPGIEAYLTRLLDTKYPLPGSAQPSFVRSSMFFPDRHQLVLSVGNNRYCHNIGRHHKSNGTYYVFQLANCLYSQRCYDPDCRHFMSREEALPIQVNPYMSTDDWEDGDIQDTPIVPHHDDDDDFGDGGLPDEMILEAIATDTAHVWG